MDPISGEPGARRITLTEPTDRPNLASAHRNLAIHGFRRDYDPNGTGSVVDGQPDSVREGRGCLREDAGYRDARTLEGLTGRPRRDGECLGQDAQADLANGTRRDPQRSLAVPLVEHPFDHDLRSRRQPARHRSIQVEPDPCGPVLDETRVLGFEGAESCGEDALDCHTRAIGQRTSIGDGDTAGTR